MSLIPLTHTDLTGKISSPYIISWFRQTVGEYPTWRWALQDASVLLQDVKCPGLLGFHLRHSYDDFDFDAGESFVFAVTFRAPAAADLEAALLFSRFSPDSSMLPPLQRQVCQKVSANRQNE